MCFFVAIFLIFPVPINWWKKVDFWHNCANRVCCFESFVFCPTQFSPPFIQSIQSKPNNENDPRSILAIFFDSLKHQVSWWRSFLSKNVNMEPILLWCVKRGLSFPFVLYYPYTLFWFFFTLLILLCFFASLFIFFYFIANYWGGTFYTKSKPQTTCTVALCPLFPIFTAGQAPLRSGLTETKLMTNAYECVCVFFFGVYVYVYC